MIAPETMRVVQAYPPNIDEIDAAFNVRGKPVFFAWGNIIYNPIGTPVAKELFHHEAVHGVRQGNDIAGWWTKYIANPRFRLQEEIPAHIAEFEAICSWNRGKFKSERVMRRVAAAHVARRLSAPLYGKLLSFEDAKKAILRAQPSINKAA